MKQIIIYYLNSFILLILVVLIILLGVAFLTLMERKLLGYIQLRKGPNKVGFFGIFQPFSDAIKLIRKERFLIYKSNFLIYYFTPIFILVLILIIWIIYPFKVSLLVIDLGVIFLIVCFRLRVYGLLLTGWSSNSSYSMLGSIRSLSQSISYEVRLSIIILVVVIFMESFNLIDFLNFQFLINLLNLIWPLRLIFLFSLIAELNRTPFDFSEGESELVSGFNIDYMRRGFIIIFLSEYARIIFLRFLFMVFFSFRRINLYFYIKIILIIFLVVWLRGTIPRFRYDLLIYFCWLIILPFSLNYIFIILIIKFLI